MSDIEVREKEQVRGGGGDGKDWEPQPSSVDLNHITFGGNVTGGRVSKFRNIVPLGKSNLKNFMESYDTNNS